MERQILSMDRGWRFHEGDIPINRYKLHDILYMSTRSACARGAGRRDLDDSQWRLVNLPHDYVVEGTPTPEAPGSHGSLVRRNAWYRKTFKLSEADRGKHMVIHFEGVCSACEVFVNGIPMGHNFTAGVGFDVNITDVAHYGENVNVVAVYIDNREYEGWYYEGGGIYRHVWLIKTGKVHVDLWGTFVNSTPAEGDSWNSQIDTEIRNDFDEDKEVTVLSEIIDPQGETVASVSSELKLKARRVYKAVQNGVVPKVQVWGLETPWIYKLRTTIFIGTEVEDTYVTDFGYRTIQYTVNDGFFLNGKKTFILGYGSHQDLTGFGIGITDSIQEFRMRRLQSLGYNLFRTAHNPFAPALYDACDRLGLMCMDENRRFRSTPEVIDEVVRMVKRDRNHPSIIMWSLFNEEDSRMNEVGSNIYRRLSATVHEYDPTRPTTGADNFATWIPGAMDDIELIGINHVYNYEMLDVVRNNNPNKPIFFTEENLTSEIREYVRARPYILGAVGWAGLPYRGETKWPQLHAGAPGSLCHPFTLLCDPNDLFYWNKATWVAQPVLKITSHWTHKGKEGTMIPVLVYSNCDEVELFLNGKSCGKKSVCSHTRSVSFDVVYEPGALVAVGIYEGKEVTDRLETVGEAFALKLIIENPGVRKNGRDTAIISVFLVDREGRKMPEAPEHLVEFFVKQGGRILCVGSPNKCDHEPWQIPQIHLYENKGQVYVECDAVTDVLEVEAVCEGFASAVITIEKATGEAVCEVPYEDNRFLEKWYVSPALVNQPMPDIDGMHRNPDLNGWILFEVGRGNSNSFVGLFPRKPQDSECDEQGTVRLIYYHKTKVPKCSGVYEKTVLYFEKYEGAGKVVVFGGDKRFEAEKTSFRAMPLAVDTTGLKEGEEVEIWAVLEADTMFSAINKPVRWCFE